MRITIPDTRYRGVLVPGGWSIEIPDISIERDSPRYQELVTLYARLGMSRFDAEEAAIESCIALWRSIWNERIRKSVGRYAKKYADGHFGSLEGFDPEKIAALWLPGENHFWLHGGNPLMRKAMAEMGRGRDE